MNRKLLLFFLYTSAVANQFWLGISVFVSFMLAPILFFNFPTELAADILSKIFPLYGKVVVVCVFFVLVGLLFWLKSKSKPNSLVDRVAPAIIFVASILSLLQTFYIFPLTKTLRDAVKSGRAAGNLDSIAPQAQSLMQWHSIAVVINNILIVIAIASTWQFFRILRTIDSLNSGRK